MSALIESLRKAMSDSGLVFSGQIIADGAIHRFDCDGESGASSWYVAYSADRFMAAAIGCWRRNVNYTWNSSNGVPLSPEDKAQFDKYISESKEQRRTAEEKLHFEAKTKAQKILSSAQVVSEHPYLAKKKVQLYGEARFVADGDFKDCLILPMRDTNGILHTAEFIAPDKRFGRPDAKRDKNLLFGGDPKGHFYTIHDDPKLPLVICEGYATGATIFEATGFAVVCARNAGNLLAVSLAFRAKYRSRAILIACDNDERLLPDSETNRKRGVYFATEAAKKTNSIVVCPQFDEYDTLSTDFNDLAKLSGINVVRKFFTAALPMPIIVDATDFLSEIIPTPDELVQGILHRGCKLVLGGGSKTYKTWTLFDLAVSVSTGGSWLNFDCKKGRVLYINFEIQSAFFQKRLKSILEAKGIVLNRDCLEIWNLRGHASDYISLIPKMIEHSKSRNYSLIIIDPIYKLYGELNENSAGEVARLLNSLDSLCVETGAAVAFGAHYSKGNQAAKESIDRISGSGVFSRDPDSILSFTKHEQDGAFTVDCTLRNHPAIEPFVVEWDFPIFKVGNLDPDNLKQAKGGRSKMFSEKQILDLLGTKSLKLSDWLELAELELGISKSSFLRLRKSLIRQKLVFVSQINGLYQTSYQNK